MTPSPPPCAEQSRQDFLCAAAVLGERAVKGRHEIALSESHPAGHPLHFLPRRRQAVRLALGHHLYAILSTAQETVGAQKIRRLGFRQQSDLGQGNQCLLRRATAYLWNSAAVKQYERLSHRLHVAYATRADLHVCGISRASPGPFNFVLEVLYGGDALVVHRRAIDHRIYR